MEPQAELLGGPLTTEELREAMVHWCALFENMIEGRQPVTTEVRS
jgi:hypothetical protein